MRPVHWTFEQQGLQIFGANGPVDAETLAEIEAQNIEASKSEPVCLRCDDTGIIEHDAGWGVGVPCNCEAGGDVV